MSLIYILITFTSPWHPKGQKPLDAVETTDCNWPIRSSFLPFICIQRKWVWTILTFTLLPAWLIPQGSCAEQHNQGSETVIQLTHTQSWGLLFWQAYGCSAGSPRPISARPHNSSPAFLEVKAPRGQPSHRSVLSYINQTKE